MEVYKLTGRPASPFAGVLRFFQILSTQNPIPSATPGNSALSEEALWRQAPIALYKVTEPKSKAVTNGNLLCNAERLFPGTPVMFGGRVLSS